MTNYQAARINMVDSQINTMGVVNDTILEAFRTVPRELFVPENRRGIAYSDEDMPIGEGRCLMEPVTHARLLQAAQPVPEDIALDVGGATGYSAAILAGMVNRVVTVEMSDNFLSYAQDIWKKLEIPNITAHQGRFSEGCAAHAPYSLILLNGTVASIPHALVSQLAPGGRLLAVVKGRADKIGKAVLLQKSTEGVLSERILFDAAVPYLPGFEPRNEFVF